MRKKDVFWLNLPTTVKKIKLDAYLPPFTNSRYVKTIKVKIKPLKYDNIFMYLNNLG